MDSPLLPTLRHGTSPHSPTSPSMLADLSLSDALADESFVPLPLPKPGPPVSPPYEDVRTVPALSGSIASSSRSTSQVYAPLEDVKNKAKPRFSLFAPSRPAQGGSGSSSTGPARIRPSHAPVRNQAGVNGQDDDGEEGIAGDDADDGYEDDEQGGDEEDEDGDATIHPTIQAHDQAHSLPPQSSADRDDRLRESLYELRRMNEVFDGFLGALEAARGHNMRLAARVKQTSELLDRYTALLGQSEHTQRLLSNPLWTGADDDLAALQADEASRLAAEEAEAERVRLAEERAAADEERRRAQAEAEKARAAQTPARGGLRGRGAGPGRGIPKGRGSSIPVGPSRTVSATTARPGQTVKRVVSTSGPGLAGKYDHVQSSGYGPAKRG